jgi:O-acetyl-ADP-ribose deacetylase
MKAKEIDGDLLEQCVDAIVNPWNRNIIPWWLLIPQGVSRAIKKRAGVEPFRELARHGPIPLGQAVVTAAGLLPFRYIIHVAGINLLWRASEQSIRDSVSNALRLARRHNVKTVAMPLIGSGSGGFDELRARSVITDALATEPDDLEVTLVRFKQPGSRSA